MRRAFLITVAVAIVACEHDELDFRLPDAGGDDEAAAEHAGQDGAARPGDPGSCAAGALGASSEQGVAGDGWEGGNGSGANSSGSEDNSSVGADDPNEANGGAGESESGDGIGVFEGDERYQDDPNGYPAGPGQEPPWCGSEQTFEELCGSDIDEDCDGTVDEYEGIGQRCRSACGEGIYVCERKTGALVCSGCSMDVPEPCGDGFVGPGEECDPSVAGEQLGVTCTASCERPRFVRCVDSAGAHPEFCRDEIERCSERIGACVPVLGPRQRRCPEIPIEDGGAGAAYPMLEVQREEKGPWECWVTCSESEQCPTAVLTDCYMGFCSVPL